MFTGKIIRKIIQYKRKRVLRQCGVNVDVQRDCNLVGNIYVGNNVLIGRRANFVSTKAELHIHDYVVFGPDVTIYTGDHATDIIGVHIYEITDKMKDEQGKKYDKDVCIESGCWIGTRAIILKGVTVGRGSVIGAGSVVTKDVPPYSIFTGSGSNATIKKRFSDDQIVQHERLLVKAGKSVE